MAVVVTGAAGFIGRAVLRLLVARGEPVVAVDRRTAGRRPGVRALTADLLDADDAVSAALRCADSVIHLAGCPGVRDHRPDVAHRRRRDNVDATVRVLDAVPAGVPVVVASSSSVYGGATGGRPSAETDPLAPTGGYALSKAAVEALCSERAAAGALVTTARPFTVAGEGQRPDMALSRWIAAVRLGRPVQVYGSTGRRRDVTDVRAAAAALVGLAGLGVPGPVNVGTGTGHSLAELVAAVESAVGGRADVEVLPAAPEEVPETLADTRRLRELLGWVPRTDLHDVVRRQARTQVTGAAPGGTGRRTWGVRGVTVTATRTTAGPVRPGPDRRPGSRLVAAGVLLAAAVALLAALAGAGVRSTFGGHAAVDEPQYLLTAVSLWEDRDLDISDELAAERWREFSDVRLPVQTTVLADGRQLSPHDPLLPLLLAAPVGMFGWMAAKVVLAMLAASTAALTCWVAVRRFAVPVWLAAVGTGVLFATPPLAVYGQQVYPEMPAALAALAAVAALTGRARWRNDVVLVAAVVVLPWLGVKYAPVAAVLAVLGLVRAFRSGRVRAAALSVTALGVAGAGYLLLHRLVWGGWTVYAAGDHFRAGGEFSVMGVAPDYADRTVRLVGLLVDREFGLVPWQPALLLLVPASAALLRWRAWSLLVPVAAGWATATWLALTMHGFWWPGRQVVVVLPITVVGLLWWLARLRPVAVRRGVLLVAGVVAGAGCATYVALLVDGHAGRLTWVHDFPAVDAPVYRALRPLLPDYRGSDVLVPHLLWVTALLGLACLGWSNAARVSRLRPPRAVPSTKEKRTKHDQSDIHVAGPPGRGGARAHGRPRHRA